MKSQESDVREKKKRREKWIWHKQINIHEDKKKIDFYNQETAAKSDKIKDVQVWMI